MKNELQEVDLNSDLGEGFGPYQIGDDEAMLDLVTSANVACGFHGGDPAMAPVLADIASAGGKSLALQWDLGDLSVIDANISRIEAELGPVDILINNTGG